MLRWETNLDIVVVQPEKRERVSNSESVDMADINGNQDRNRHDGVGTTGARRNRWLPWVIGGILLLVLFLALRSCGDDDSTDASQTVAEAPVAGAADIAPATATDETLDWNSETFATYLASTDPVGRSFALGRVTFASGSALLNNDAKAQVGEVATALKGRPTARVSLRGYADPAGDAAANQALSQQRTDAVRNALIGAGAGENQVTSASALGETGSAAVEGNRRVEITLTAR